ncbi:hypothetical protein ACE7GA_25400 [Roseomonas sp. CCTCC AB2023176]|uniref:hypothetical protein n=1 Tax=Roseomonas sp. CCTCC AB2023176 TaxID=3342640 RepID=UPI0035DB3EBF
MVRCTRRRPRSAATEEFRTMRRIILLAALLPLGTARAEAPSYATWQVETLVPAACVAANLPSRDCLCLMDALERHLELATPLPATAAGGTGFLPREGAGHAAAITAALRGCAPTDTAQR